VFPVEYLLIQRHKSKLYSSPSHFICVCLDRLSVDQVSVQAAVLVVCVMQVSAGEEKNAVSGPLRLQKQKTDLLCYFYHVRDSFFGQWICFNIFTAGYSLSVEFGAQVCQEVCKIIMN